MKHIILQAICLFLLSLTNSCHDENVSGCDYQLEETRLEVCSFNIRFDNPQDGRNSWSNRRKEIVTYLSIESPDIIGLQEVLINQLEYIHKRLSEYEYVGVGRDDGDKAGEFVPVFYRKERFKLMDKGTFWLSETPRTPSVGWDAQLKRICTYAFLQDKKTGKKLQFYNTHFSHVGESARTNSASLIIHYIDSLSQAGRVILTGDLNAEPDSPPYKTIKENGMKDSYNSGLNFGPYGTYNGFDIHGPYRRRIDYIFHKGFHSKSYQSINLLIDNRYLSDHFPIWSTLEYSPL